MTFRIWLEDELKIRNWKQADLVRESGLASAVVSNIVNGKRKMGETTATAIARAFKLPPDLVFEKAGLLPPKQNHTPLQRAIISMIENLPENDLQMVESWLRTYAEKQKR